MAGRYTRKQVAEMVGKSANTIYRWEKAGKTPAPNRTLHNGECIYTDAIVAAIRQFLSQEVPPPNPPSANDSSSQPAA